MPLRPQLAVSQNVQMNTSLILIQFYFEKVILMLFPPSCTPFPFQISLPFLHALTSQYKQPVAVIKQLAFGSAESRGPGR